jgi:rhodanese-related sulfurtransferase
MVAQSVIGEILGGPRRRPYPLARACLLVLAAAMAGGLAFNLFMPQGIGWLPPEIKAPRYALAGLEKVKELHAQGALFVDARDAGSYAQARLRGAVKLPADELAQMFPLLKPTLEAAPALVVYGRSLSRFPAATVGQFLVAQGFATVWVSEYCLDSLQVAGLPVQQRRKAAQP